MIGVYDTDDSVTIVERDDHPQDRVPSRGHALGFVVERICRTARQRQRSNSQWAGALRLSHGSVSREQRLMGPDENELAPVLLALSLRDDGFGTAAPSLKWDITLAMAWTSAKVREDGKDYNLAFRWQLHEHPSPLRLLNWTKEWREFMEALTGTGQDLTERIAYAWIYYQLRWLRVNQWNGGQNQKDQQSRMKRPLDEVPEPLADNFTSGWKQLLKHGPETGSDEDGQRWHTRTLPLMARPELGLPRNVQEDLLTHAQSVPLEIDSRWLASQRLRLITDAIVASDLATGKKTPERESQETAKALSRVFELRQRGLEPKDSPWKTIVTASQVDV